MMRAWLFVILASCGDNAMAPVDSPPPMRPDGPAPTPLCDAEFSGNFVESVPMQANCAMVSGTTTLAFEIPSYQPGMIVAIDFELGATPNPGVYSSESVAMWSATGTVMIVNSKCIYAAGTTAVPPGAFTMMLDAIDTARGTAHGQLALQLAVLPGAETDCGMSNMETLDLTF
jgi:hypothetical protein